jgi:hypothetical protein
MYRSSKKNVSIFEKHFLFISPDLTTSRTDITSEGFYAIKDFHFVTRFEGYRKVLAYSGTMAPFSVPDSASNDIICVGF